MDLSEIMSALQTVGKVFHAVSIVQALYWSWRINQTSQDTKIKWLWGIFKEFLLPTQSRGGMLAQRGWPLGCISYFRRLFDIYFFITIIDRKFDLRLICNSTSRLKSQVFSKLSPRLKSEFKNLFFDELNRALCEKSEEIADELFAKFRLRLPSSFEFEEIPQLGPKKKPEIANTLIPQPQHQLKSSLQSQLQPALLSRVFSLSHSLLQPQLKSLLTDLACKLHAKLAPELELELAPELASELASELVSELESKLMQELAREFASKWWSELQPKLASGLTLELASKLASKFSRQIKINSEEEIRELINEFSNFVNRMQLESLDPSNCELNKLSASNFDLDELMSSLNRDLSIKSSINSLNKELKVRLFILFIFLFFNFMYIKRSSKKIFFLKNAGDFFDLISLAGIVINIFSDFKAILQLWRTWTYCIRFTYFSVDRTS